MAHVSAPPPPHCCAQAAAGGGHGNRRSSTKSLCQKNTFLCFFTSEILLLIAQKMASNAAKRITSHSVDWQAFAKRIVSAETQNFRSFKARADGYLARVHSLPSKPPSIDFQHYSGAVGASARPIVEKLKQSYEQFQVPPATDGGRLAEIAEQQSEVREDLDKLRQSTVDGQATVAAAYSKWEECAPLTEMTHEEHYLAFPHLYINEDMKIEPFGVFDAPKEERVQLGLGSREMVLTEEEEIEWEKRRYIQDDQIGFLNPDMEMWPQSESSGESKK